ncbi:hypothetical protein [Thiomicrorhabdus lithotrophica]|uniref:Uncharacterized protein n=1 Tax=Thiomicrorhabdus lithotrophica TaxID=2949997 RepID=A0ABY8CEA5_9GAMM|nr:hypothetical protein [Thiomicrorhabdus lithotrophica]WEJ62463.1 hypothetical protein NR989_10670 [Thiomicrorhabdus lithotrophica]
MQENNNLKDYKGEQKRESSEMVNRAPERRVESERRDDVRDSAWALRSIRSWITSLIKPRLGVDRRKGRDRRANRLDQAV